MLMTTIDKLKKESVVGFSHLQKSRETINRL